MFTFSLSSRLCPWPPLAVLVCAFFASCVQVRAADLTGQQIYVKHCASCHGDQGQGVKAEYPDPLIGTRSLESLTKYIDKRMPEDDPKLVSGKDAEAVSKYIFDAFYSPVAQAKKNPPKIELSRLTAGQYRNAVMDLVASFTPPPAVKLEERAQHGLKGEYSAGGRRFRDDKIALTRLDAGVDFDFGENGPDAKVPKDEYAIRWSGVIHIEQAGEYEFIVKTKNGMRLWVNDDRQPLVDAWVRSGESFEYRETVYLLGGRDYPLRLEMFKEKKEKVAAVSLKWKRPQHPEEAIPASVLSPARGVPLYVVRTPFPPDDRSMGYERGTFINKAWDEATTDAAIEAAAYIAARHPSMTSPNAKTELPQFARQLAERAFRRPLSPEQQKFFVDRHFENATDLELALRKSAILIFKSPRFLYHEAGMVENDAYAAAARLAFAMWDSLPDRPLTEAARAGKLATRQGVMAQIDRMMADPRTKAKVKGFFHTWLNLDRMHELAKDPKEFPQFTPAIVADLRTSLDLFLDDVWGEATGSSASTADYRRLMLTDEMYMNGRLAEFYGVNLPKDAPFQKVKVPHRAGVITHPLLMAGFAYTSASSPIHRGVFVSRNLLGRRLKPPPVAIAPASVDLNPDLTTRQRTELQTAEKTCMACHAMINPLGFTFENYDAVGRFRKEEKKRPVDATGFYQTAGGETVNFSNAAELGAFLIRSEEAQVAFVERFFHHVVKQPILAHGYDTPEKLRGVFVKRDYNVKALLAEIAAAASGVR